MPLYEAHESNSDVDEVSVLPQLNTDAAKDAFAIKFDKLNLSETDVPSDSPPSSPINASHDCAEEPQSPKTALPEDPFESAASKVLFEAIDKLQSCNARRYMNNIPQLVIVGGQSVGKSSLLQSLTGIPFAVGSTLCTRFATRIVSRRSEPGSQTVIRISISPPEFAVPGIELADPEVYKRFDEIHGSITSDDFANIIDMVSETYLGIRPGSGNIHKNFAAEVLKIEISGPTRAYFSILDIPGVFENSERVKKSEASGVKNMVAEYMRQEDNIVICVADANTDLANQAICEIARDRATSDRLVGVFTKCDRVENTDAVVHTVVSAPKGGQFSKHGWFVVRNKKGLDDDVVDFDLVSEEDQLFSSKAWDEIPSSRKGTTALKKYLGHILSERIRSAFPSIIRQAQLLQRDAVRELTSLGSERKTVSEQRSFLATIARNYEAKATEALMQPWCITSPESRVRSIVKATNESFGAKMRAYGHTYCFDNNMESFDDMIRKLQNEMYPDESVDLTESIERPEVLMPADDEFSEVLSTEDLFDKIAEEVATFSSATLPGMVHPDIIPQLYRLQTQKWRQIAEEHVRNISDAITTATCHLIQSVCPRGNDASILNAEISEIISKMHRQTLSRTLEALHDYCDGNQSQLLQTADPTFLERLQKLQKVRLINAFNRGSVLFREATAARASSLQAACELFAQCHPSAAANTSNDVHDTLKVYYEVRFFFMIEL
ncbi:hypothetical protein VHEMI02851 [[Torrubiella] hemipterigena]|uniref:Dynamin GTPase domain-containing protein n=1 Tax=[Torrubiella] hemipterigena TaxID=1531966 RepID=A0A0A1TBP8_9HYPO|nr:hypothetical protein VHEMI02851 [[Torrubiella] hemipterigena]